MATTGESSRASSQVQLVRVEQLLVVFVSPSLSLSLSLPSTSHSPFFTAYLIFKDNQLFKLQAKPAFNFA